MKYFLIGFMGSGKTYAGKRIAEELNLPFYDLDEYLEEKEGKKISEIFQSKGEDYFRQIERMCLRDFGIIGDAVIACGGGTPCFFDNLEWINKTGISIYLQTPVKLLVERLSKNQSERPLITGKSKSELREFVEEKLKERTEFYLKASIIYHQHNADDDVVGEILAHLSQISGDEL
jgi:shikimate kinase